jgi:15-cis-phytoene desaturase
MARLVPAEWPQEDVLPQAASRFVPSPYVSCYLWFDRKLTHERFWARIWQRGDLNTDFYDLSNIREGAPEAPSLIACNAIHACDVQQWPDDAIVKRSTEEIAEFAPAATNARLRHAVVHRIPMAIACPLPGSEHDRPRAVTPFHGLWLAGDWTRTDMPSSMESAARSACIAAEQVAHSFGLRLNLVQPLPQPTGLMALLAGRSRRPDQAP